MSTAPSLEVSTPLTETPDLVRPLTRLFEDAERDVPDRVFLASRSLPGEQYTFGRLAREARALARHLVSAGLRPGDRVALLCENRPRWCVAYAAALFADAVVVPLDPGASGELLARILADAGARHVLVSDLARRKLAEARAHGAAPSELLLDGDGPRTWEQVIASAPAVPLPPTLGGDRVAALLYTSGTTGDPKGVILTHANLQAEIRAVQEALAFGPDDVMLMFLPLQHVLSQVGSFLLPAAVRIRVVHAAITRGEELVEAVREEGVTILLAVPLLYHLLHERILARFRSLPWPLRALAPRLLALNRRLIERHEVDFGPLLFRAVHRQLGPRLRLMVSGGAPLSLEVQRDFVGMGFCLVQAYGLTETSGGACFARPDDVAPGTVGKPLPGVTVRLDSPDGEGVGEVCLRGPSLTPGYHGRPEATAALWRDGWLRTGDLGTLDEDGNLRITGRMKDVIVLGSGKNVYPEDVEAHYARCPSVREVCVVGRRASGGASERLHGVVVPDWDALRARGVTAVRDAIRFEIEGASLKLPAWQRLLSFEIRRDPLPRTATRKLQRYLVKPALEDEGGLPEPRADEPDVAARLDGEAGRALVALVRQRVGERPVVRGHSSLELDLGLDSLNRMELVLSVESAFGIRVTDEEAADLHSVDDVLRLVLARTAGGVQGGDGDRSSWSGIVADATLDDLPDWLRPRRSAAGTLVALAGVRGVGLVAKLAFRLKARGVEHLPAEGPYLVCPNHVSLLDGFLVAATFPRHVVRDAFVVGEREYVTGPIVGRLSRLFGVVPLDANRALRQTMRIGAAGLKAGRILLIFPEGVRAADGRLGEIKLGAPVLAAELGVPIVPVVIDGAWEAWPRGQSWPRPHRVTVTFGPPLLPSEVLGAEGDPARRHARLAAALRDALVALGART